MNAAVENPVDTLEGATEAVAPPKSKSKGKEKTDDLLVQIVQEVSSLSAEEALNSVPHLLDNADGNYFRLGGVLALIQTHKFYESEGFESFKTYVETKYGKTQYRKSMYWIRIYNKLIESGVSWNKVKLVGWTKLKDLADILTIENVDEWVQRALSSTTLQLQEAIKKATSGILPSSGIVPEDDKPSEVTTLTFKVHQDQKTVINEAIDKALAESNTEYKGVALENICMNYLAGGNVTGKPAPLAETLKKYSPEDALLALEAAFPEFEITAKVKKSHG